jgi:hypothetical protein
MYIADDITTSLDVFDTYIQKHSNKAIQTQTREIYLNQHNKVVGVKGQYGYWKLYKYDKYGNKIYSQDSDGNWEKRKYDFNKIKQFSNSSGVHWVRKVWN